MRRTIIFLYLLCISLLVYAQTWDFFYDGSKYYKFSEKKYNTIMGTNCYDESGNVIDKIKENNIFSSSKTLDEHFHHCIAIKISLLFLKNLLKKYQKFI